MRVVWRGSCTKSPQASQVSLGLYPRCRESIGAREEKMTRKRTCCTLDGFLMSHILTAPSALPLAKSGRRKLPRSYRLTSPAAALADADVIAVGGSPKVITAAA
jgi:hypothetical protein